MTDPIRLVSALENGNVQAFLKMLRHGEGTTDENGYRRMFGGKLFDSFVDHPRETQTATFSSGQTVSSTAAGAYQFLSKTWDGLVRQYGFKDFSPKNQDLGAVALILGRKALDDVLAGRFEEAVNKCNREWASLPGSPYGQPVITMAKAKQLYEMYGGKYEEQPMTPFIAAALPAIIEAVPKLAALFSSGSETAQRNIKAAETVVSVAKEAIQATNEQELVERLKTDPEAVAQVREAVQKNWFEIHQQAEKSIAAAREFAVSYSKDKDVRTVVGSLTFIEVLALLMMGISAAGGLAVLFYGDFSPELRGSIVTLMLIGGWTGVREFFFGSSPAEQARAKD